MLNVVELNEKTSKRAHNEVNTWLFASLWSAIRVINVNVSLNERNFNAFVSLSGDTVQPRSARLASSFSEGGSGGGWGPLEVRGEVFAKRL
jgi:hypothetical protein